MKCFACLEDALRELPDKQRGNFFVHALACVSALGEDAIVASLCAPHAKLYDACCEGCDEGKNIAAAKRGAS